jgi:hypothetical protein
MDIRMLFWLHVYMDECVPEIVPTLVSLAEAVLGRLASLLS